MISRRLLPAVGLGYVAPHRFQTNLYTRKPELGKCGDNLAAGGVLASVASSIYSQLHSWRAQHEGERAPCCCPSTLQSRT